MRLIPLRLYPLVLLTALSCSAALAQTQTVVVTGNPLGRDGLAQATTVLAGDGLALRRGASLGETLDGLPGVASTAFGPNAGRPVIRGLDGDRVRLLDNGGSSIDASSLSFDHASATDPLVAERIEVLRGPAALLYGGTATGGVVNTIDNRIPRLPSPGLSGRTEVRLGGAARERSGAAVLEGGAGRWAWHADAFGRSASDLRVPVYTPVAGAEPLAPSTRVRNSAARGEGGAVGGGWVSEQGYLGASVETARNRYGVTVEPDVFIRMQRDRLALAGEWRGLAGPLAQVSAQASHTRYRHDEVEGSGDIGTAFKSTGDDLRLAARHAPLSTALGPLQGVLGVQAERMDFSALGAEAFVPGTQTQSTAVFAMEELQAGLLRLGAGLRSERVRVASDGDAAGAEAARFGSPSQRRYTPASASLSATLGGAEGWQGSLLLGHTERAPAYYELYANGVHVATAAYERGDATLGLERSRHVEAGLAWAHGAHRFKVSVYQTRFSRYIALGATGVDIVVPGEDGGPDSTVPEYAFRAVHARLQGYEFEGRTRLRRGGDWVLELSGSLDGVRGDDLDAGEPLPRVAPRRARIALDAAASSWRFGVGLRHNARQARVPKVDAATPGWTQLDLWASGALPLAVPASWFARIGNATDRLAYHAGSIATVRGLSPLAGRALTLGLRARF